ncbi:MAG: hypothetical protein Q8L98_00560 [Chlamydiales bacterium]|nr:hypothetical protein [Chlamydiales bacterium]
MDTNPPRFLIMVTVAVFIFMAAAALLVAQVRSSKSDKIEQLVEVAE